MQQQSEGEMEETLSFLASQAYNVDKWVAAVCLQTASQRVPAQNFPVNEERCCCFTGHSQGHRRKGDMWKLNWNRLKEDVGWWSSWAKIQEWHKNEPQAELRGTLTVFMQDAEHNATSGDSVMAHNLTNKNRSQGIYDLVIWSFSAINQPCLLSVESTRPFKISLFPLFPSKEWVMHLWVIQL